MRWRASRLATAHPIGTLTLRQAQAQELAYKWKHG
jgi:hypothetical protein